MGLNNPGAKWTDSAGATVTPRAGGLNIAGGVEAIVVVVVVVVFSAGMDVSVNYLLSDFLSCFSSSDFWPSLSWESETSQMGI